jgi:hypothetical protein
MAVATPRTPTTPSTPAAPSAPSASGDGIKWKTWLTLGLKSSDPNATPPGQVPGKRTPTPNAVFTGETAITREQAEKDRLAKLSPPPLPSTAEAASIATVTAKTAAERQKKRAAGGSLLVGAPKLEGAPVAKLAPRTLLGGGY